MGEKPVVIWLGERNLEKSPTRFPSFVQSARVMHFLFRRWDNGVLQHGVLQRPVEKKS